MNISIIIPARNEEKLLPECLKSIQNSIKISNLSVEIVVVADCCKDRTIDIAEEYGCKVYKVHFSSRSKSRNYGFSKTNGDFLVFLDADTMISNDFLKKTIDLLCEYPVVWYLQQTLERSLLADFYFKTINYLSNFRPTFSPAIGVRANYFKESDGFNESLKSYEDYYFLHKAWKNRATKFCRANVRTSMRRVIKFGLYKATLYFILAWLNPVEFEWRPINV